MSQSFRTRWLGRPLLWASVAARCIAGVHIFSQYFYSWGLTEGPSMLPSFDIYGTRALCSRLHRRGKDVEVGDLIDYRIPIFTGVNGIKRVIGMPGDYVLVDSPDSGSQEMIQVPQGHCWIVGDNLPYSRDSRLFGAVPLALVRGKIIAVRRPLCDWPRLETRWPLWNTRLHWKIEWPLWEFKWVENPLRTPPPRVATTS